MAVQYRDINLNFVPNPITGDIGSYTNESAINRSIRNLVMSNIYDRFFDPTKAGGVTELLFENITPLTLSMIERRVTDVIDNFEPRADLISVKAETVTDNGISVRIKYSTRLSTQPETFDLLITRVL